MQKNIVFISVGQQQQKFNWNISSTMNIIKFAFRINMYNEPSVMLLYYTYVENRTAIENEKHDKFIGCTQQQQKKNLHWSSIEK